MTRKRGVASIALAGLLSALTASVASAGEIAVGLTDANTLVTFPVDDPGAATPAAINFPYVDGGIFGPDTTLVGLDHRPRGGALYAQASRGTLYVLTPAGGGFNAIPVNVTPVVSPFGVSARSDFGFGFNPVADAIRVVEEENLNLRVSPDNGNVLATDGALNPGDPRIVAADYTNAFDGATATTLYDIDSGSDRLLTQTPPNAGTLVDVGPLGVDTTDNAGLDIAPATGTAYAAFELAGRPGGSVLHRIELSTGAATPAGAIAGRPLKSLSVVPASVLQFTTGVSQGGQVPVTRTGPANRTVTVSYAFSGGGGGTLTFAPGVYQQNIAVGTDTVITLGGASANAVLGPQSSTRVVVGADTRAPVLTAKAKRKRDRVHVRFTCDEACFVRATVRRGNKTVGTASSRLGGAGSGRLKIRVRADRRKLTLRLTARDRAGNARTLSVPVGDAPRGKPAGRGASPRG